MPETKRYVVWTCHIGVEAPCPLPLSADFPMRERVMEAFLDVTGVPAVAVFSGWGGDFTEAQKDLIAEGPPNSERSHPCLDWDTGEHR